MILLMLAMIERKLDTCVMDDWRSFLLALGIARSERFAAKRMVDYTQARI